MIEDESTTKSRWLETIKTLSKHGSLLPTQIELLERVYDSIRSQEKKVCVFVAPPASGKTHVICLLAAYLSQSGAVAIVVPSNYLKSEFESEFKSVSSTDPKVDIMNISEFLRNNTDYDF